MSNVNVGTGEVCHARTDFILGGIIPIEFTRIYRSNNPRSGPIGRGWQHNLEMTLSIEGEHFTFRDGRGAEWNFDAVTPGESSTHGPESPFAPKLIRDSVKLEIVTPDRRLIVFPPDIERQGTLDATSYQDRNGNALTFVYAAPRLLVRVQNGRGEYVDFQYGMLGKLLGIWASSYEKRDVRYFLAEYSGENLISVTDADGRSDHYAYDDHLMVRHVNKLGGTCYFEYDEKRRCHRYWRDKGIRYRQFDYDDLRKVTMVTDALGRRTLYNLDDNSLVTSQIDPLGHINHSVYTQQGDFVLSASDAGNSLSSEVFDPTSGKLTMSDALGRTTVFAFDGQRNPVSITEANGTKWEADYDERGNLTRILTPSGATWTYGYDMSGLPASSISPDGREVTVLRTDDARSGEIRDQLGQICSFSYGDWARLKTVTDALGNTTNLEYDVLGHLTAIQKPNGETARYGWDAEGNLVSFTDESGRRSTFEYNPFGVCTGKSDPAGNVVRYHYDLELQLTGVVDPNGDSLTVVYDLLGRPLEQTWFDGRRYSYTYAPDGALIGLRDLQSGATMYMEYNGFHQVTRVSLAKGKGISYEYDDARRLIRASSSENSSEWKFDPVGNLLTSKCAGDSLVFEYDVMNRRTLMKVGRLDIRYQYDLRGRLTSISWSEDASYRFDYDEADRVALRWLPNGCSERITYDKSSLPIASLVLSALGLIIVARKYEFDPSGKLIRVSGTSPKSFVYDQCGRLARVESSDGAEEYLYDAAGNLVLAPGVGQIRYGPGGVVISTGAEQYLYSPSGDLYARRGESDTTIYSFSAGCLKKLDSGSRAVTFMYDAIQRRIRKSDRNATSTFTWDGRFVVQESTDVGTATRTYIAAPGSFVALGFLEGDTSYSYVVDPSGTPKEVIDGAGRIAWAAELTGFGVVKTIRANEVSNPLRFQGQYDDGSGLYYNNFRYYLPALGRYASPDPIGLAAGHNQYSYAVDPINTVDPLGLASLVMPSSVISYSVLPCTPTPAAPPGCGPSNPPRTPTPNNPRGCGVPPNLRGGGGPVHNQAINDIDQLNGLSTNPGNSDFRVNQQQVTAGNIRVGANRPDMQVLIGTQRNYIEVDTHPATRAGCHAHQICNNDPAGVIHLVTI